MVTRDGVKRETNTIILIFQTTIFPKTLKVGYLKVPVQTYTYQSPYNAIYASNLGIMKADATRVLTTKYVVVVLEPINMHASPCADDCQKKLKCVSCGGEHMATSRSCPVWQREKEILSVKYREGLSFQDAR